MASYQCPERTNCYWVCRLLLEGGKELLIQFLRQSIGSSTLDAFLAANRNTANRLLVRNIIHQPQMDILYPPGGGATDTHNWDITLTACILKALVYPIDPKQEAAIKDMRELRNKLYGHIGEFEMGEAEFNRSWRDIKQVLQAGAKFLLNDPSNFNLFSMVDDIKKDNVTNEEMLKGIFQSWKESDKDVLEAIAAQDAKLDDIRQTVNIIRRTQTSYIEGGQNKVEVPGITIVEAAAMPKEKPRDDGGDECPEHRGKLIELYCHSDRTLACVLCIAESHRACTDVTSISKLSAGLEQSRELRGVKLSARKHKTLLGSCRKDIDEYRILNDGWYDKSVKEFEAFKSKLEAGLDLLGKSVYREAEEMKERNKEKLDNLSHTMELLEKELESLMSDIETKETTKKMDQLFIFIKNKAKDVVENRRKVDEMKKDLHIQTYTFVADPYILQILHKMVSPHSLKILSGYVKCTAAINIKAPEDKKDSSITGLVEISPTDIVAADGFNNCLKQIDVVKMSIVTRRTLSSSPCDVTVIHGSRVAVTVPDRHEIQYFDTQKQLAPCGSIHMESRCLAIQSTEDTLIVSFGDPAKVEMMDLTGHVKRSFTTDSRGTQLFDWPRYISLSPDHTDIYVSDTRNRVMTCLSTTGRVNWKYTGKRVVPEERDDRENEGEEEAENDSEDEPEHTTGDEEEKNTEGEHKNDNECFSPRGLATGADGCVYIYSYRTGSIHVVSPAGIRLRIIPGIQYRLRDPWAVCYSKTHESLYLSSWSDAPDYCNFIRRLSFSRP